MEHVSIARVALAAATYAIDRPYDYQIPQELEGRAAPGVRVIVPFGAGNRRTEGLILALDRRNPSGKEDKGCPYRFG